MSVKLDNFFPHDWMDLKLNPNAPKWGKERKMEKIEKIAGIGFSVLVVLFALVMGALLLVMSTGLIFDYKIPHRIYEILIGTAGVAVFFGVIGALFSRR